MCVCVWHTLHEHRGLRHVPKLGNYDAQIKDKIDAATILHVRMQIFVFYVYMNIYACLATHN